MTKEVFKWLLLIFFYVEICNSLRNSHRPKQTESIKNEKRIQSRQNDQKTSDPEMTREDILRNTNDITKGLRSYENLIGQLRYNWEMPSTYLEKRGYLVSEKPTAKLNSDNHQRTDAVEGYSSNSQEYESNKLPNFRENEATFVNEGVIQQTRMSRNNDIANNFKLTIPQFSGKSKDDPKEVYFASDYKDDNEEDDKYYLRTKLQNRNTEDNKLGLVKKNPNTYEYPPMTGSILSNLDTADRNIKFDDLFNNLSRADIDYVKSFLKCFRENKKQFIVDYLHINESDHKATNGNPTGTTTNGNTTATNGNTTATNGNTTKTTTPAPSTTGAKSSLFGNPFKAKLKGENATSINSTSPNAAETSTTCANTSAVCNAATKTEKPGGGEGGTKNITENKFGISQQNVKVNVDLNANNSEEGEAKSSKCTPIRLNEMSLDLEVAEQNSSDKDKNLNQVPYDGYNFENKADDFASHFLASSNKIPQLPFEMKSPYADNFLDQSDGVVYDDDVFLEEPLPKVSKKRQATFEEQDKHNIPDRNSRKSSRVQDYYSDYPDESSNFHEYDFGADEARNKVDNNVDNQQRNQKQKLKYKRRKKGKRTKNFNAESNDSNNPKLDAPAEEKKPTMPKTETDHGFPELSDIKFRINEVQEEAIEKFIESLNSPPEVFSFDVEKYLKEPENRVAKDVLTINSPQTKAFYEFPNSARFENEQVPFIPKDKKPESDMPSRADFENERTNNEPMKPKYKRDILREFIKGVANNYLDVKPPEDVCLEMSNEGPLNNGVAFTNYEEPTEVKTQDLNELGQNYFIPNNQYMDVPLLVRETKQDEDDFIDKYYLLNDGKSPFYKTTTKEMKTLYDPQALSIDMDLDKKFKDLKYGKRDFIAERKKGKENERSVPIDVYILSKDNNNAQIDIPQ